MARVSLLLGCGLLIVVAGCGDTRGGDRAGEVRMQIQVSSGAPAGLTEVWSAGKRQPLPAGSQTQTFTLTCNPTGGTLPLADRICQDVNLHPQAMLDPGPVRETCHFPTWAPVVSVAATANGKRTTFGGLPGCMRPGGTALALYEDATQRQTTDMPFGEALLHCDEGTAAHAPPASVAACRNGLWTPYFVQLVGVAAQADAIRPLEQAHLFPARIGAQGCSIPHGGPSGGVLRGRCGVYVNDSGKTAVVTFLEYWGRQPLDLVLRPREGKPRAFRESMWVLSPRLHHSWSITVRAGRVVGTSEAGAEPPQRWR